MADSTPHPLAEIVMAGPIAAQPPSSGDRNQTGVTLPVAMS
jgi:hypothetical protein